MEGAIWGPEKIVKSKTLVALIAVALLAVLASPALAQTEPYSGGTVTETTIAPRIIVTAEGLTVAFTAAGANDPCGWDFGDGTTGSGNPATHTYAAEGSYTITATCGALVLARTVSFAEAISFTGFESGPWAIAALTLILLGAVILWATRRRRRAGRHLET